MLIIGLKVSTESMLLYNLSPRHHGLLHYMYITAPYCIGGIVYKLCSTLHTGRTGRTIVLDEAPSILSSLQCLLVQLSSEDVPVVSFSDFSDDRTNPCPFFFVSDAISPPSVHTASKTTGVQLSRFALLIQNMQ